MVASVMFSIILVAGLAVYAAAQGREGLYSAADAEDSLGDSFQVLAAAGGFNLLLGLQGFASSHLLGCSTALAALSQEASGLTDLQSAGGLTVSSSAKLVPGPDADAAVPGLSPYGGSVAGDLDVALTSTGAGSAGPGVTFDRTETVFAHLPLRLVGAVQDCGALVNAIRDVLAGASAPNCTAAAVTTITEGAVRGPAAKAAADGFQVRVSYQVAQGGSCRVSYSVTLEEPGVQGPGGVFTARFEEGGTAPLAT